MKLVLEDYPRSYIFNSETLKITFSSNGISVNDNLIKDSHDISIDNPVIKFDDNNTNILLNKHTLIKNGSKIYKNINVEIIDFHDNVILSKFIDKYMIIVLNDDMERNFQSSLIPSETQPYMQVVKDGIFVLTRDCVISKFDFECKEVDKIYESEYIKPVPIVYNEQFIYFSNGQMVTLTPKKVVDFISIVTVDKVYAKHKDYVFIARKNKTICFDLVTKNIVYEISGNSKIKNMVFYKFGRDFCIFSTEDGHIGVLDVQNGKILFYISVNGLKDLCLCPEPVIKTYDGDYKKLKFLSEK